MMNGRKHDRTMMTAGKLAVTAHDLWYQSIFMIFIPIYTCSCAILNIGCGYGIHYMYVMCTFLAILEGDR